jgi:hypothetical protein
LSDSFTNWTNNNANSHMFYKIIDGTEGGNVQVTLGTNSKAAAVAYTIQAGTFATSIAPVSSTVATGTSVNPNATAVSPTGSAKDYLYLTWFYSAGEEADDDTWVSVTPTSYSNTVMSTSGTASTAATNTSIAAAEFRSTATTTQDASAWTMAQSLAWRAYTVAVYPVQTGSFTFNAIIKATVSTTDTLDAILLRTQSSTFTLDAVIFKVATADNAYETEVLADSPAFVFSLEEASGEFADLMSPSTLSPNNSPTYGQTGPISGKTAVKLNTGGVGTAYLSAADRTAFDMADGDWTFELWFKRTAGTQHGSAFFSKGTGGTPIALIDDSALGVISAYARGVAFSVDTGAFTVTDTTTWHHLVITKTTSGDTWKIYVDGVDRTNIVASPTSTSDNSSDFNVGRDNGGTPGSYAELILAYVIGYKSVLSPTRVTAHYDAGIGVTTVNGSFTVNAILLKTYSFTAPLDAILLRTYSSSNTLDAILLKTASASFTFDALIVQLIWKDTFTRTVASGWGTPDIGNGYDMAGASEASVNGSAGLLEGGFPGAGGIREFETGLIQFDLLTDPSGGSSSFYLRSGGRVFAVDTAENSGTAAVNDLNAVGGASISAAPGNSEWWRAKFWWGDGWKRVKLWKVGDTEPDWGQSIAESTRNPAGADEHYLYGGSSVPHFNRIDNIYVWMASGPSWTMGQATLDAVLLKTTATTFTLNAVLFRTITVSPTLDAVLKKTQSASFSLDAILKDTLVYGPGLTTVAQDSFTEASDTSLNSHTAETGGTWSSTTGTNTPFVRASTDQLVVPGNFSIAPAIFTARLAVSAGDVDAYLTMAINANQPGAGGPALRMNAARTNYYAAIFSPETENLVLTRVTAGTPTVITFINKSTLGWTNARIKLEAVGVSPTTLRARVWDASTSEPVAWDIDTTNNTAGNQIASDGAGVYLDRGDDTEGGSYEQNFDDFLVTSGTAADGAGKTLDAVLARTISASFAVDSILFKTTSGSFSLDAIVRKTMVVSSDPTAPWVLTDRSTGTTGSKTTVMYGGDWVYTFSDDVSVFSSITGVQRVRTNIWNDNVQRSRYVNGYYFIFYGQGPASDSILMYATDPYGPFSYVADHPFQDIEITDIDFDGTYYVIVGNNGRIAYSTTPGGTYTYAASTVFGGSIITSVAYGNGIWVAVGASGKVATASDPTGTWTLNTQGSVGITFVRYGDDGYFVASQDVTTLYTTTPAGSWSSIQITGFESTNRVTRGGGKWVGWHSVGGEITQAGIFVADTPAGPWQHAPLTPYVENIALADVAYGNGQWLVNGTYNFNGYVWRTNGVILDAVFLKSASASFTLDAVLARTTTSSLALDAVLFKTTSSTFSLDAAIAQIVLLDTFTRTVPLGEELGGVWRMEIPTDPGGPFDPPQVISVDGSVGHVRGNTNIVHVGFPLIKSGEIRFDFLFPSGLSGNDSFEFNIDHQTSYIQWLVQNGFGTPYLQVNTYNDSSPNLFIDYDTWYTTKFNFPSSDAPAYTTTWKRSDPEPGTPTDVQTFFDPTANNPTLWQYLLVMGTNATIDSLFDNVQIRTSEGFTTWTLFNFNAIKLRTQAGSLTLDAILLRTQAGSFALDAELVVGLTTVNGSFALDAVVLRTQAASAALDAILLRTSTGSATLDAVTLRTQTGSFTADAVIGATRSGSATADAVLLATRSATASLDAVVKATTTGSGTLDAVLLRTITGSATLDAVVLRATTSSLTLDAILLRGSTGSFALDAIALRTTTTAVSLDAVLFATTTSSFTLDATIMPVASLDAILLRTQTGSATLDAVVMPSATLDAVLLATVTSSFTLDAFVAGVNTYAFGMDAVLLRTATGTFSTDAIVNRTATATLSIDAVIHRVQVASFALDAVQLKTISSTFTADAVLLATRTAGFTVDAVVLSSSSASFTLDAVVAGGTSFVVSLDAIIKQESTASADLNAVLSRSVSGSATLDASVRVIGTGSGTLDSIFLRSQAGSFSLQAVLLGSRTGSGTLDSTIRATIGGSYSLDAYVAAVQTSSFGLDAILEKTVQGQLDVAAVLRATHTASLLLDAFLNVQSQGQWSFDAVLVATTAASFTTNAYLVAAPTDIVIPISAALAADTIGAQLGVGTISPALAGDFISWTATDGVISGEPEANTLRAT